jgi:hypothetical protein
MFKNFHILCDFMPTGETHIPGPDGEPVIPEVIEAYRILAKYSFDAKISSEDENRVLELLGKVPQGSPNYNKLQTAIAAINVEGEGRTAARALKDYMIRCGKDPGEIMDLHLESRDKYEEGVGPRHPSGNRYAESSELAINGETLLSYKNGILKLCPELYFQLKDIKLSTEGRNLEISIPMIDEPILLRGVKSIQPL